MDKFIGREFERNTILIGKEKQLLIADSRIAIFGLGGVGTFAAESLARSGAGKFILVDFDKIGLSNINRQIIATHDTLAGIK